MEFKALRMAALTEEIAINLNTLLGELPGVTEFAITLDTQEISIVFDEEQLSFGDLVAELTKAGCPLTHIDAALLL